MSDASVLLFVVLLEVVPISCAFPACTPVDDGTEYPLLLKLIIGDLITFLNGWGYSCFMEVDKKFINALYALCWHTRYHIFAKLASCGSLTKQG